MERSNRLYVFILTVPALVFFLAFFAYPVGLLVYNSFFSVSLLNLQQRVFVGLANYQGILASAQDLTIFGQTLKFTAITLGSEFVLGFAAALTFNAIGKRSEGLRTLFLFPLMVAPIVAGLLWRFLLIDNFGLLNYVLKVIGLIKMPSDIAWLSNPNIVLFSVALPDIWLTTCFVTMILYAGLQNIPLEILEAAKVDGANAVQRFWNITVPLLRPVIAAAVILRGIDASRTFDSIWIMTGGGPMGSSEVLSLRIYLTMIRYGRFGEAAAMATLFLGFLLILSLIAFFTIWKPSSAEA